VKMGWRAWLTGVGGSGAGLWMAGIGVPGSSRVSAGEAKGVDVGVVGKGEDNTAAYDAARRRLSMFEAGDIIGGGARSRGGAGLQRGRR